MMFGIKSCLATARILLILGGRYFAKYGIHSDRNNNTELLLVIVETNMLLRLIERNAFA